MACSEDNTTCCVFHGDCNLNSGSGAQAKVNNCKTQSLKRCHYNLTNHFTRDPAVTTDYECPIRTALHDPGPVSRRETYNIYRGKSRPGRTANGTPDPGDGFN